MGLEKIVTMHDPIFDADGDPHLLAVSAGRLSTDDGGLDHRWYGFNGFAFVVPPLVPQHSALILD